MTRPVGGGSAPREEDPVLPPGPVLLALVWFARRQAQESGRDYLRCRFVVVSGPRKGVGFFTPWGLNTESVGTRKRWELWMEAIGCDKAVDLDSDQQIAQHFLGKAFKAQLKVQERNGRRSNDIERVIFPRTYSPLDRAEIAAWAKEWEERGWQGRDPNDPGPQDRGQPQRSHQEPAWSEGSSFRDDEPAGGGSDDIPF